MHVTQYHALIYQTTGTVFSYFSVAGHSDAAESELSEQAAVAEAAMHAYAEQAIFFNIHMSPIDGK